MLGTNDFKSVYNRTATQVANALAKLVEDVKSLAYDKNQSVPQIILVSPILIDSNAPRFAEFYTGSYDERSMTESHKLASEIERVASNNGCLFVNAAEVSMPGEDGIHFSAESCSPLAELLAGKINSLSKKER
jgi:lysophospholipase L1-like esterase